jgi:hypothetical protein
LKIYKEHLQFNNGLLEREGQCRAWSTVRKHSVPGEKQQGLRPDGAGNRRKGLMDSTAVEEVESGSWGIDWLCVFSLGIRGLGTSIGPDFRKEREGE